MATFAVVLPAAGRSSRFSHKKLKKPFVELDGRAVWIRALEPFINRDDVVQTLVVISPEDREEFKRRFGPTIAFMGVQVINGGEERADSIQAALARVNPDVDCVAVHDAVRPCMVGEWIDPLFEQAEKTGAAILAVPVNDTLKRATDGVIAETVPRSGLWAAQTPQVFRRQLLLDAYAARGDLTPTDDAQLVEALGHPVSVVQGSPLNVKITTSEDLKLAGAALKVLPKPKVSGPIHPFADEQMW
jgi:2-C-methyl-D-erythritol 4-phosphate cytidylyltransferase